ncbi:MAG: type I restriction endonuclease subunit M [Betaproteobacteria bacterium]
MKGPLFELGQVVATLSAIDLFPQPSNYLAQCLARHHSGDWGCVCAEDAASNDEAVTQGLRIMSAYPIDSAKPCKGFGDNCLWIITEADRSSTTVLLPNEY